MSAPVSISRQRAVVESAAASVRGGWGQIRQSERERLAEDLKAAAKTLAWLERNEHRIHNALGERRDP